MSRSRKQERAQEIFAEHYQSRAKFYGSEDVKKIAAAARRSATGVATALKTFEAMLTSEQRRQLIEASSIMRELAADLDICVRMADRTKEQYDIDEKARREREADAIAAERWNGDDKAMLSEAAELSAFMDQWDARELDAWLCEGRASGCRYTRLPDVPPGMQLARVLSLLDRLDMTFVRRRAAEYLGALQQAQTMRNRRFKEMYYVAYDDYQARREWQRAVMEAIRPPR